MARRRKQGGVVRRYATEIGLVLAGLALVVSAVAIWPAVVSNDIAQNPHLDIANVGVSTRDVTAISEDATGMTESTTAKVDVAAALVTVRNSGEEPALLTTLRVFVERVWLPVGCLGGGPGLTRTTYDFVLPGTVDVAPKPVVLEKEIQFVVGGKALEQVGVTVGQEVIGETGWSWIILASVEVVQDNGETLRTEPVVLMDSARVDGIVANARENLEGLDPEFGQAYRRCVEDNLRLLDDVLAMDQKKSSAIGELRERLVRLGYHAPSVIVPSEPAGGAAADSWIAQLASLPGSTAAEEVARQRSRIAEETGLDAFVLNSSDFASLNPGYWVVYATGDFADGYQALDACRARGRTSEESCVGRYLSHAASDREFVCRFSHGPGDPHCVRD